MVRALFCFARELLLLVYGSKLLLGSKNAYIFIILLYELLKLWIGEIRHG